MGFLESIMNSPFLVQAIAFLLLCMSIGSWAIIVWKLVSYRKLEKTINNIRLMTSSQGMRVSELKTRLEDTVPEKIILSTAQLAAKMAGKCKSIEEISHIEKMIKDSANASLYNFREKLERFTPYLATISLIAPYVGLLGTVLGLLSAFQCLAGVKVVTFQTVAPSIVESLFSTALGLFVAIPASAGFNIITKNSSSILGQLGMINNSLINQISQIMCSNLQEQKNRG